MTFLASFPSPSFEAIDVGVFEIRLYGVALAVGVFVAYLIGLRRWTGVGGDPEVLTRVAFWMVPGGIIGARIYHVITDFDRYSDDLGGIFEIWNGGLGIWGAVSAGALVAYLVLRNTGESVGKLIWAVVPAVPVGQAVGRLGNYFNQELFGRPTDLPWAVEIDIAQRPAEYATFDTFHPTFLYEALWNLALAAVLIWVVPRLVRWMRPYSPALAGVYMFGYCAGRVWIELLRVDDASRLLGLRVNVWTSIVVGLVGAGLVIGAWMRAREDGAGGAADVGDSGGVGDSVDSGASESLPDSNGVLDFEERPS